VNSAALEMHH